MYLRSSWVLVAMMLILGVVGQARTQATRPTEAPASSRPASNVKNLTVAPESVGLSSERLERIGRNIQKSVDENRIAGAVSLVARHGKIAYIKAFGMANRADKKPMQTDQIFRICSMTKPITSVAAMMLYEEGRFLLNEPVANFIPEFKEMKVLDPLYTEDKTSPPGSLTEAKRPITIRHLLTHTSGLTYHWNARLGKQYREAGMGHGVLHQEGTIGDAVKRLARLPLLFHPGDAWEYSVADDVLGYLVEVVSGMPLDKFLYERLFKPLAQDTGFFLPQEKVSCWPRRIPTTPKGLELFRDQQ
jgi:CubicO group peptidase (beta-lactamase class C family)